MQYLFLRPQFFVKGKEDKSMVDAIKKNIEEIIKWANIIFLFLFSLHLFNFPDKYVILWCTFSIALFWLLHKELCLDKMFWVLSLAIILNGIGTYYYLAESLSYSISDIIKMVVPTILVYPFMKQFMCNKKDADVEKIILAIVVGTFIYSVLNYYMLAKYGFYKGDYRGWSDFWTNYSWRATHHSYWGCFVAGLLGYAIYCLYEKKWLKGLLFIGMVIIENYIQIAGDNRMVLCVTVVALAVSLALFCFMNIKDSNKIKRVLFAVLIIVIIGIVFLWLDPFGIRSSGYYQRFVTRNGGILKNDRFLMIYEAILMLPSHWKGGAIMYAGGNYWVHNYWLQVANVSGIVPFVLWMIVNISAVADVIRLIRSPYVSNKIKYMFIPMLSAIVGYLMMEPGGTELNRYIIFYVILIAILKQLANKKEKNIGAENV